MLLLPRFHCVEDDDVGSDDDEAGQNECKHNDEISVAWPEIHDLQDRQASQRERETPHHNHACDDNTSVVCYVAMFCRKTNGIHSLQADHCKIHDRG